MNKMDSQDFLDDFDNFDDSIQGTKKTIKQSELDDLESIRSEDQVDSGHRKRSTRYKNGNMNSVIKSFNESGVKKDTKDKPDPFDDEFMDSFDDKFEEHTQQKKSKAVDSEIDDESFLRQEKKTMNPEDIGSIKLSHDKENKGSNIEKSHLKKSAFKPKPKTPVSVQKSTKRNNSMQNKTQLENGTKKTKKYTYKMVNRKSKAKKPQPPANLNIMEIAEENKRLFSELKNINDKLSKIIENKGFKNMLNKEKEKNTEFKYRPVATKISTFNKEIKNNEKIIELLQKELNLYKETSKKLDSTDLLNELNKKILNFETSIKERKTEIYQLQVEYKKNENIIQNQYHKEKKSVNFKNLMVELDSYMTKNNELNERISKLEKLKTDLKEESKRIEKENGDVNKELEKNNLVGFDDKLVQKHATLVKIKKRWNSHLVVHEKNIKLKMKFIEKDCEKFDKESNEYRQKIAKTNEQLNKQIELFKKWEKDPNIDLYNFDFSLKYTTENEPEKPLKEVKVKRRKSQVKNSSVKKKRNFNSPSVNKKVVNKKKSNKPNILIKKTKEPEKKVHVTKPHKPAEKKREASSKKSLLINKSVIQEKSANKPAKETLKKDDSLDNIFDKKEPQKEKNTLKVKEEDNDGLSFLDDKSVKQKSRKSGQDDDFDFLD